MPVAALKEAQAGRFCTEKVKPPFEPLVVGVNTYAVPAVTCVAGLPEIESGATTRIENAGRLLD